MGIYLDSTSTYTMYTEVYQSPYFVDKSTILEDIFPRIDTSEKFICVTRPRRFGKSVMADMIASFFSKGCDVLCH